MPNHAPTNAESRKRMLNRIVGLYVESQQRRYMPSLAELAAAYGCSKRTIRRDLEAFEESGVLVRWRQVG